eukprot:CAMPEP_0169362946 /NCGR_PEP_ID=MMETSP1017-20121227/31185_1 /TAXON_ID=342587 /ORGANISM="Karlodinium micrum, Strain CCMP2283" /LENGTH=131 /DNA_ID=CAMNT_0009460511 /DNA_START=526 /DNA_END=918 /DNA_ORIENTATION=-
METSVESGFLGESSGGTGKSASVSSFASGSAAALCRKIRRQYGKVAPSQQTDCTLRATPSRGVCGAKSLSSQHVLSSSSRISARSSPQQQQLLQKMLESPMLANPGRRNSIKFTSGVTKQRFTFLEVQSLS